MNGPMKDPRYRICTSNPWLAEHVRVRALADLLNLYVLFEGDLRGRENEADFTIYHVSNPEGPLETLHGEQNATSYLMDSIRERLSEAKL